MKILVLGATGYVGAKIMQHLEARALSATPVSRATTDYTHRETLAGFIVETGATHLINAAGYTGKPNVDACETDRAACLAGNAVLPGTIVSAIADAEAATRREIVWGHVASGCIYSGFGPDGEGGRGWREDDAPNFSFRSPPCSWYSGTKALGEEVLVDAPRCYQWRLRIPFNHEDSSRNYISKLLTYEWLLDATNSISHIDDFAAACVNCLLSGAPFGTYNLTNSGTIRARDVVAAIEASGIAPGHSFKWFADEAEFMARKAKTPRSNCVLDSSKSAAAGFGMRPIEDAIKDALDNWVPANK